MTLGSARRGTPAWRKVRADDGTRIAWRVDAPDGSHGIRTRLPAPLAQTVVPTVVLCNGIACDDGYWDAIWPRLVERGRVIRWHYRGHGRSDTPEDLEQTSVAAVVDDLFAVLEAAGEGPVVLVGHSFGVQVVLEAWHRRPDAVAGIVAVAGAPGHPLGTVSGRNPAALLFPVMQTVTAPVAGMVTAVAGAAMRSPIGYWTGRAIGGIGPDAPRAAMRSYFDHVAARDLPTLLRMFAAMQDHDRSDVLEELTVPVTIVAGEADRMTPQRVAEAMADRVPEARLVLVPGATHVLPVEAPEIVAAEVHRMLDRLRPTGTDDARAGRRAPVTAAS